MPELPEVETVRRTLQQLVAGKTITGCSVTWPKMVKNPDDVQAFCQELHGQRIQAIERRGKFLKFILDEYVLVSHLRMEGRYAVHTHDEPLTKHTHAVFSFADGTELRYQDVRKFGTFHLFPKGTEEARLPLSQLGPEPFSEEFTVPYLQSQCQRTARFIKVVLLDQRVVTGLGNIYVDEALFRSGVHPERAASSLTQAEITTLHHEIIDTLAEAVEKGGSTVRSYVNTQGKIGMFQLSHYVYGKKGEPCTQCGAAIEKKTVGGRGTHYCANCQQ